MPEMTFETGFMLTDMGRAALGQPTVIDLYEPDADEPDYCPAYTCFGIHEAI